MKPTNVSIRTAVALSCGLFLAALSTFVAQAYDTYDGCVTCHGDFLGPTSPQGTVFPSSDKHEMHRASGAMGTTCNLCHFGSSRTPVYIGKSNGTANNTGIGCSGCHNGPGLRLHHDKNGITECIDCHGAATAPPENVKPPYYGTTDTKAKNPGNTVKAANTNENWSVGDFLGLDNDGNNLYDLADYAVGPFELLSAKPQGPDMLITWLTAGGRTNRIQASKTVNTGYVDASPLIGIPGVGLVTNVYLEIGGATNKERFYRMLGIVP